MLNKEEEAVTDAELEDLLDALERRYGGYAFDEDVEVRVLNPWSILNFFSDSDPYLTGYWFEGGGFPPVLKKAMIEGIVNHNKDFCTDPVLAISWEDFAQPQSYDTMAPETLLFLTGYLTLASSISMHSTVELRMPNSEIKNPYSWLVCSTLIQNPYLRVSAHDICTLQSTTEYAAFLNKILDLLPSDVCPLSSATSVSDFLSIFFSGANIDCCSDKNEQHDGSALIVDLEDRRLVFEFQYASKGSSEQSKQKMLDAAVEQLNSHNYDNTLHRPRGPVVRIALVYAEDTRQFVLSQGMITD